MKKKFLVALSLFFVFSMVAVAFAYTGTNASENAKTASCPMHKESASASGEQQDSCCGMKDCCRDGKCSMGGAYCKTDKADCPMKRNAKNESGEMQMQNVTFVKSEEGDCCKSVADCCKSGGVCCAKHKQS